jgi:hypothetical protein
MAGQSDSPRTLLQQGVRDSRTAPRALDGAKAAFGTGMNFTLGTGNLMF